MTGAIEAPYRRSTGLVDVLDRVLDKGLVVAGDIRVSLAEGELLTIRIRLLVCSIDKAEQIGLDWWGAGAAPPAAPPAARATPGRGGRPRGEADGGAGPAPRRPPPAGAAQAETPASVA